MAEPDPVGKMLDELLKVPGWPSTSHGSRRRWRMAGYSELGEQVTSLELTSKRIVTILFT